MLVIGPWQEIQQIQPNQSNHIIHLMMDAFNGGTSAAWILLLKFSRNGLHPNQISIYAYTVATPDDEFLTWPLHGKQLTLGIIEGGKSDKDRLVNKRSFYTSPSGTKWDNPSKYGSGNSGWSSFMSHDLFYYKNWSFVHDDSVKFFFKVRVLKYRFLFVLTDDCS